MNYKNPLWNKEGMDKIYADAVVTQDTALGNIDVEVRRCDGTPVEGAVVTFSPPAGAMRYLNDDTTPNAGRAWTSSVSPSVIGYNVPVDTSITVTVTANNLTFEPMQLQVSPMENNVILMHPYEQ